MRTIGKNRGIARLADADGHFRMVALDQRPPLFDAIAQAKGITRDQVEYSDVTAAKRLLSVHLRQRRALGHERPTSPPSDRDQMTALHECRQRLTERRPRDPELVGQGALRRQLTARGQESSADRRAQSLDGLLERRRRANRGEHRLDGRIPVHVRKVIALAR